ncbi:MAG: magnesium transporter CorA family protein [Candidatus Nealsonbacteria bacterium]|nr:magnesium transporter CorA family protein [Candidatus Nealsonbacteria bacterium]
MRNIIRNQKTTWIDITKPTRQDMDYLKDQYHFHHMVLEQLIPRSYYPRLEVGSDYLFLIVNYPTYYEINHDVLPREVDIILTKEVIVTNHLRPLPLLENLFKVCQRPEIEGEKYLEKGPGFILFSILNIFWRDCLVKLDKLNDEIEKIERKIFQGKEKDMVMQISHTKTDIIDFWRIVEPQYEIMRLLEKEGPKFFGQDLALYFSDALGTYEKVWQNLKAHKETIFALEKTNQSLLTTKTNEIIKILTVFSIITLPLVVWSSVWGMNVGLPFSGHKAGFWIVISLMFASMAFMFLYFRKKRWL